MSATNQDRNTDNTRSGKKTADDIRQAFSGLPFEQQFSTLIRIELDMIGDAVETVVSAASKAIDDIAAACTGPAGTKTSSSDGQTSTSGA